MIDAPRVATPPDDLRCQVCGRPIFVTAYHGMEVGWLHDDTFAEGCDA